MPHISYGNLAPFNILEFLPEGTEERKLGTSCFWTIYEKANTLLMETPGLKVYRNNKTGSKDRELFPRIPESSELKDATVRIDSMGTNELGYLGRKLKSRLSLEKRWARMIP